MFVCQQGVCQRGICSTCKGGVTFSVFVQEHTGGTYALFCCCCCVLSLKCDIFFFGWKLFSKSFRKKEDASMSREFFIFFACKKVQEFKTANTNLTCHPRDAIRLSPRFVRWLRAPVVFSMPEWDVCVRVGGSQPFLSV